MSHTEQGLQYYSLIYFNSSLYGVGEELTILG
jgi:hypothetical protein